MTEEFAKVEAQINSALNLRAYKNPGDGMSQTISNDLMVRIAMQMMRDLSRLADAVEQIANQK